MGGREGGSGGPETRRGLTESKRGRTGVRRGGKKAEGKRGKGKEIWWRSMLPPLLRVVSW